MNFQLQNFGSFLVLGEGEEEKKQRKLKHSPTHDM